MEQDIKQKITVCRNKGFTGNMMTKKKKKIMFFSNHSQYEWPKCSHEVEQGCRLDGRKDLSVCCLQETHFELKDTESEGMGEQLFMPTVLKRKLW